MGQLGTGDPEATEVDHGEPYARVTVTVELPGEPRLVFDYPKCHRLSYEHVDVVNLPELLDARSLPPAPSGVGCKLALFEFVAARPPEKHVVYTLTTSPGATSWTPPN